MRDRERWFYALNREDVDPTEAELEPVMSRPAVASVIAAVLWLYGVGSLAALVLGSLAIMDIDQAARPVRGRGLAWAGSILGFVGLVAGGVVAFA